MNLQASSCIYEIDANDELVYCNSDWYLFAEENSSPELACEDILGRSIWDSIGDSSTIELYRKLIDHVREDNEVKFSIRCDSPSLIRVLKMHLTKEDEGRVRFTTSVEMSEARASIPLLEPGPRSSAMPILVCSWCANINVGTDDWQDVETAITVMKIFEQEELPALSHGICRVCYTKMQRLLPNTK